MACYHPLYAINIGTLLNGKKNLVFPNQEKARALVKSGQATEQLIPLPCGQCIGCRLERSRQWAIRCQHEASLYLENCFITLTYDDAHLPRAVDPATGELVGTLRPRDMTLFLKNLRERNPGRRIRFFQCGEYGELCQNCNVPQYQCKCGNYQPIPGRPHHHILLFNYRPPKEDMLYWKTVNGEKLYVSKTIAKLWKHGISAIGNVTFESSAYVARYVTKKINGDRAELHYGPRLPEYITMSRRPGIARDWIDQYADGVYNLDSVVLRNIKMKPPRYYDKLYELREPSKYAKIKDKRLANAKNNQDNTPDRLAAREAVKLSKAKLLVRRIENGGMNPNENTDLLHLRQKSGILPTPQPSKN